VNQHSFRFDRASPADQASYVCWTRMQTEAGQPLADIIKRKELERQAGDGVFFWGVGNAPSTLIKPLARVGVQIPVIFSVMKSAPRKVDEDPTGTLLWEGYIDHDSMERDVPPHVMVTSRSETGSGPKTVHYALMCHSEAPLELRTDHSFNHREYRNAGTGGAIGASQVTALLEPHIEASARPAEYSQSLVADLIGSYWVKLTRPKLLERTKPEVGVETLFDYRRLVSQCRTTGKPEDALSTAGLLL
jgi:hypothetical protein